MVERYRMGTVHGTARVPMRTRLAARLARIRKEEPSRRCHLKVMGTLEGVDQDERAPARRLLRRAAVRAHP